MKFKLRKGKNFLSLWDSIWLDSEKLGYEDEIREVIKHGTMSVGFIGLAECLKALIGKHHGESEETRIRIKNCNPYASVRRGQPILETKLYPIGYPPEGTAGRFVKIDRDFGNIPGITDRNTTLIASIFLYIIKSMLLIKLGWRHPIMN